MSNVLFYLKNEPDFKKKPRIKEYFEQSTGNRYVGSDGQSREEIKIGHVDESIKALHKEEYEAFSKYVNENSEALYSQCASAGELKFDYKAPVVEKKKKEEVKTPENPEGTVVAPLEKPKKEPKKSKEK